MIIAGLLKSSQFIGIQAPYEKSDLSPSSYGFSPSTRLSPLRRQAARPPKKIPAKVNTQMVMVTAYSLVVIIAAS